MGTHAQYYANMRGARPCTVIDVVEGEGTPESPIRLVSYVYERGGFLFVYDPQGIITKPNQALKPVPS